MGCIATGIARMIAELEPDRDEELLTTVSLALGFGVALTVGLGVGEGVAVIVGVVVGVGVGVGVGVRATTFTSPLINVGAGISVLSDPSS